MISLTDKEFTQITSYLKQYYGINLSHKRTLIEGRLSNYLTEKKFTNFGDYFQSVLADKTGNEMAFLLNKLTTNHTYFMRESEHFTFFKNTVLPALITNNRRKDLRVWSAGCSSGEEPYTLAMIIADVLGSQKQSWDTKLLATDISQRVLSLANAGIYSEESLKEMPSQWKQKYFAPYKSDTFKVVDSIKKEVIYKTFNLMDKITFKKKFQVIFCRNVMIYFDSKTKMDLVNRFYDASEPGAYLFIGHSESIIREQTKYEYVMPAVYRKPL